MKISLDWVEKFFSSPFSETPKELSEILTRAGLEVEHMEDRLCVIENVVVGEIIELEKHPNADKLTLCQVNAGSRQCLSIVCGASNHKKKDKVMVAKPGAVLAEGFRIKESRIRGEKSEGMLCSQKELGLEEDLEKGIWILPPETPVGLSLKEFLEKEEKGHRIVFDLNVTPNRADCLSHYGLARELSALLEKPVHTLKASPSGKVEEAVKVKVKDSKLCPRYTGRSISGVTIEESPPWLKNSLKAIGLNPINNVVDITNYVMFPYGAAASCL